MPNANYHEFENDKDIGAVAGAFEGVDRSAGELPHFKQVEVLSVGLV